MIELEEHNAKVYNKIVKLFPQYKSVALVQATGVGKSKVASKLSKEYFKGYKKLYLAPTVAIINNYLEYNKDDEDLECMTYSNSKLNNYSTDILIVDEFHRLGAKVWGKRIKNIKYSKMIGLSATPVRWTDKRRNMIDELFDTYVEGLDLATAIKKKVLPSFIYVSVLYSDVLTATQTLTLNGGKIIMPSAYSVVSKYLENTNGHWIVFTSSILECKKLQSLFNYWFGSKYKYEIINSTISYKEREKRLSNLREKTIIFSVNVLNEGVHLDNMAGVIMCRKTSSPNVFMQQIGRALSCSKVSCATKPVIIDLVNNYQLLSSMKSKLGNHRKYNSQDVLNELSKYIIICDYTKSIKDIVDKITPIWTEQDENLLRYCIKTNASNEVILSIFESKPNDFILEKIYGKRGVF